MCPFITFILEDLPLYGKYLDSSFPFNSLPLSIFLPLLISKTLFTSFAFCSPFLFPSEAGVFYVQAQFRSPRDPETVVELNVGCGFKLG